MQAVADRFTIHHVRFHEDRSELIDEPLPLREGLDLTQAQAAFPGLAKIFYDDDGDRMILVDSGGRMVAAL